LGGGGGGQKFFFFFWVGGGGKLVSSGKKKKLSLIKIIDLDVNEFYLRRRVLLRCFFTFKSLEKIDLTSENS